MSTAQSPLQHDHRDPRQPEERATGTTSTLNWLRAGVLGANDGSVSVAALLMGVAGATTDRATLALAGVAGLVSGALSMGAGEYVSVSTQRDAERAMVRREVGELEEDPEGELTELAGFYEIKGLGPDLARQVAEELTARDALAAHAEVELGIDPDAPSNPWHAALASFVAFTLGALVPLAPIVAAPPGAREIVTVVSVVLALALTGGVSARLGRSPVRAAVLRNVAGGMLAMGVTYAIGTLIGTGLPSGP